MLKKISLIIGILAFAAGTAFADGTKVAVLDINRVIETFSKTKKVKEEVENDEKYAAEMQKIKVEEFNKQKAKLDAAAKDLDAKRNDPTLSKTAVSKAQTETEQLYKEVMQTQQNLLKSAQEQREFLQQKFTQKTNVILQEDILPRIKDIAKEKGAEVVLNPRSGVIYFESSVDITDELLARLAKDFPEAAATEEKK